MGMRERHGRSRQTKGSRRGANGVVAQHKKPLDHINIRGSNFFIFSRSGHVSSLRTRSNEEF